jgi:hypothetical protein
VSEEGASRVSPSFHSWAALAVLVAVAVLFLAPGLLLGRVPVFRDLLVLVIPLRSYAAAAIRGGELPLWNPDLFLGAPFLANYQSALLYPPSLILYAVPFPLSLSLFLGFHLVIAGLGMTLYLKHVQRLGDFPALFGGVVFSFGGFFVSLIPLINQLEVATWAPWVLLAAQKLVSTRDIRWFLALTLFFAMQALGGAPESFALTLLLLVIDCGPEWRRAAEIGGAFLLALGLCAAQLLPTLEYAGETNRAVGLPYASVVSESLRPNSFLQLLLPHVFTDGAPSFVPEGGVPLFWSIYVGLAPLALVIVRLIAAPVSRWSLVLVAGVALALGDDGVVFPVLYEIAPRAVGLFRYPGKFFLLAHAAFAVLAAQGLAHTMAKKPTRVIITIAAIGGMAAALAAWGSLAPRSFVGFLGYAPGGLAADTYELLAAPPRWVATRGAMLAFLALAVAWSFARRRITSGGFAASLIVLTLADVLPIHSPTLAFSDWISLEGSVGTRSSGLQKGERIFHYCSSCVPSGAPGFGAWNGTLRPLDRVETRARELWSALVPDVPIVYGFAAVGGTDGWSTRDQGEFYRELALLPRDRGIHLLAALSVAQLIGQSRFDDPGLRLVAQDGESYWRYRVGEAAPRAYLAERIVTAPDTRSALDRVASADFRPGRDAVVLGADEASTVSASGAVEAITFGRELLRATCSLAAPGFLVVSDTWYPGWSATIDGAPAEIVRANGIVRGVHVGAGHHEVVMRYSPAAFHLGCWLSAVATLSLVAIIVSARIVSRKKTGA